MMRSPLTLVSFRTYALISPLVRDRWSTCRCVLCKIFNSGQNSITSWII